MIKKIFSLLLIFVSLSGCIETVVVGTVAAGAIILSDGSIFDVSQDSRLETAVEKAIKSGEDKKDYKNIDVNAFNGKVLLTGYVRNNSYKINAIQRAKSVKENFEIIDEIMVFGPDYKISSVSDSLISKQITLHLKGTKGVISGNYEYNVVDGNVYIMGIAQNQEELKKVIDITSTVKGVKKVVSYIVVTKK